MVGVQQLKRIRIFSALPDAELAGISRCFTEERIAAGEDCYVEGEPAHSACFLISGDLEVLKALPGGGAAHSPVLMPSGFQCASSTCGRSRARLRCTSETVTSPRLGVKVERPQS